MHEKRGRAAPSLVHTGGFPHRNNIPLLGCLGAAAARQILGDNNWLSGAESGHRVGCLGCGGIRVWGFAGDLTWVRVASRGSRGSRANRR